MKNIELPKFVSKKSVLIKSASIYYVMGFDFNKSNNKSNINFYICMDVLSGVITSLTEDSLSVCFYDDNKVWTAAGNKDKVDWAYYNKNCYRAERLCGPAAKLGGTLWYSWDGIITSDVEKFFESLSIEDRKEASFNIDQFSRNQK